MKTIRYSLIALSLLLHAGLFAQHQPTPQHMQALRLMQKVSLSPELSTRGGEEGLLDSTVCEKIADEEWITYERTYYSYDETDRLVLDSTSQLREDLGEWTPLNLSLYAYAPGNELHSTRIVTYDTMAGEWMPDTLRIRNEYQGGVLIAVWSEIYNFWDEVWQTEFVDSLIYDANGTLIARRAYYSDGTFAAPITRVFYGYENGILTTEIFQFFFEGSGWINFFRQTFFYENGVLSARQVDYYDEATSNFYESELETFEYDEEARVKFTQAALWAGEWLVVQRCENFYSEGIPSSAGEVPLTRTAILMANPFNGGQVAAPSLDPGKSYQVAVFHTSGQAVFQQALEGNTWQIPALPGSGIYVLVIRDGGKMVASRKIAAAY